MSKSSRLRQQFATESLDLVTIDVEQFRRAVAEHTSLLPPSTREKLTKLDTSNEFLDRLYDDLLPTLRQITTRSNKSVLRDTLATTFLLEEDEVTRFTETFRDHRVGRLLEAFIESSHLSSNQQKTALAVLSGLTATEQTTLIENYYADRAYRATAARTLVSFVDPTTSWKSRRAAKKHVAREQQTYSDSFKQHRENVVYRMTQLSHIYNGLLEDIVETDLDPAALTSLTNSYNRRTRTLRKQSAKLAALTKLTTPLAEKIIDRQATQYDAIDTQAHITTICARVAELSEAQRDHLVERTEEFRALAIDYSRIRSKKTPVTNDKLLVI